mgnify:FL=1
MTGPRLLIVGFGDIGQRVSQLLAPAGWDVHAVRRRPEPLNTFITWHQADYTAPNSLDFAEALQPDFVLTTLTPLSMDIGGYESGFATATRNLLQGLGDHPAKRIIMASSTRVYAETNGGWVDESSPLSTSDQRALAIIDAEQQLLQGQRPASIIRFGGIYGTTGGRLVKKVLAGRISPPMPVRYTNRIHRDDCAGFIAHLLLQAQAGEELQSIYNGVDDCPVSAHEVESWLAVKLACERVNDSQPTVAPPSHKRCRNGALRASGYPLQFPDYKSGYQSVLDHS